MDDLSTLSLVQQIQYAPELWALFKWSVLGLLGALVAIIVFLMIFIWKGHADLHDKLVGIELEMKEYYVKYDVFNNVIKDFKNELHTSMQPLCDRVTSIDAFLRAAGNTK